MKITHGLSTHPLYSIWNAMKQRCYNKKQKRYKDYGGRGIRVSNEWYHSAPTFIVWSLANGWKKGLQIDRIDNDEGYSSANCQFVTPAENTLNRRQSKRNTSGYTGVYFSKRSDLWEASLAYQNKRFYIGHFLTKEVAVYARNLYIIENKLPHLIQEIINDKNLPSP